MPTKRQLQRERADNAAFERLMKNSGDQLRGYSLRDATAYRKAYDEKGNRLRKKTPEKVKVTRKGKVTRYSNVPKRRKKK